MPAPCRVCDLSKSRRQPVPTAATPHPLNRGDVICCDMLGPIEVPSIAGARHAITFEDKATRYALVYFIEAKSDAPAALNKFLMQAAVNQDAGVPLPIGVHTTMQLDNDSVFLGEAFMRVLAMRRIQVRASAPYTPAFLAAGLSTTSSTQ